jgi:hypothetical protein
MKRLIISVLVAAALTIGLSTLVQSPANGPTIFSAMLLPFYMVGALVSGNAHEPNEVVCYLSMFLFFFAVSLAVQLTWLNWRKAER